MTIREAIELVDRMKPNQYDEAEKVAWLSELDAMIDRDILQTHEDAPEEFTGYPLLVDLETALLAPERYAQIYRWYLEMKIDDANAELVKYNNSATKFNTYYEALGNDYNRHHMPLAGATHFIL